MKDGLERQRRSTVAAALLAAALGALGPMALGGRLGWLGPVLALPVGLFLCQIWGRLGDLPGGLNAAFGPLLGRLAAWVYLVWGLFLLAGSAGRSAGRLEALLPGEWARWLVLGAALALALWLGRGDGSVAARAGRIFFLAAASALVLALVLTLPGADWKNLWPPERGDGGGLLRATLLSLGLAGYGVYGLCLPGGGEAPGGRAWAAWGCVVLAAMVLMVTGVLGPALAARVDEPFGLALEGARAAGSFRRGAAALTAVLALADVALLTVLVRGCGAMWAQAAPALGGRGGWAPVGAMFFLAGNLDGAALAWMTGTVATVGGVTLGILLPGFAVFTRRTKRPGAS